MVCCVQKENVGGVVCCVEEFELKLAYNAVRKEVLIELKSLLSFLYNFSHVMRGFSQQT